MSTRTLTLKFTARALGWGLALGVLAGGLVGLIFGVLGLILGLISGGLSGLVLGGLNGLIMAWATLRWFRPPPIGSHYVRTMLVMTGLLTFIGVTIIFSMIWSPFSNGSAALFFAIPTALIATVLAAFACVRVTTWYLKQAPTDIDVVATSH